MDQIVRIMNLYGSPRELLCSTLRNPKFLTTFLRFHTSSNKFLASDSKLEFDFDEVEVRSSTPILRRNLRSEEQFNGTEIGKVRVSKVHAELWPEWVDFMECLSKKGYFERDGLPFMKGEFNAKESNHIRTACLNFGRDRSDLIRHLSRKELQMIAGFGCPSLDRKVVNSGKRLRAHVGIDEENVCSSCNFRGECERAFVKGYKGEGVRTVDVIRVLLFYGLDHISAKAENKSCPNKKVNNSVRRLLKEIVDYSSGEHEAEADLRNSHMETSSEHPLELRETHDEETSKKQGEWLCSKCNFLNFSRNTKCLQCGSPFFEKLRKLHEDQVDLPLKKGDWICEKCNFLNFAKNSRCLECKEKPLNRHLNPGEWECESCNYINFRKNMVCLKCDHQRPKAALNSRRLSHRPAVDNDDYSFGKTVGNANLLDDKSRKNNASLWRFVENTGEYRGGLNDSRFMNISNDGNENRSSRKTDASSSWRFDENDDEDHVDSNYMRCMDFPIAGNSAQDELRRERSKSERRKDLVDATEKEDDLILRSNIIERSFKLIEASDDDDDEDEGISGWFGHEKAELDR